MSLKHKKLRLAALVASSCLLGALPALPASSAFGQAPAAGKAAAKPAGRPAVPSQAAHHKALGAIKSKYAAEYAKTSPADRVALAGEMLDRARQAGGADDDVTRYVLLTEAAKLAAAGGDPATALAAVDAMAGRFKGIDPIKLKLDAMAVAAKLPPEPARSKALVEGYLAVASEALRTGDLERPVKVVTAAEPVVLTARDKELSKRLAARKKELNDLLVEHGPSVAAARVTLKATPDDVAANTALGKFYCFVAGNWQRGIPMLAAGNDKTLRKMAENDLLGPELSASGKAKIGDTWWELAEKDTPLAQRNTRERAAYWYKLALTDMRGLQRARLEQRVALVEPAAKIAPPGGAVASKPPVKPAAPAAASGADATNVEAQRVVDLMTLVDPARDLLHSSGTWAIRTEGLVTGLDSRDALIFPYRPSDEYDFVVEFTRMRGEQAISQLMVKPGSRVVRTNDFGFEWFMGGSATPASGFRLIGGDDSSGNPPGWVEDPRVETGRRHRAVIQVRKDRVRALVDDRLVSEWATDYSDISNPYGDEVRPVQHGTFLNRLGLRTWDTAVAFHQAYVIEISGAGEALRKPTRPSTLEPGMVASTAQPGMGPGSSANGGRAGASEQPSGAAPGSGQATGPNGGPSDGGSANGGSSSGATPSGPSASGPSASGPPGSEGGPSAAVPPGYGQPPAGSGPPSGATPPPGYGQPPAGSGPPAMPGTPPGYGQAPPGSGPPGMPATPPGYGQAPPGSGPPSMPAPPPGYGKPPGGGSGGPPNVDLPSMPGYPKPPPGGGAPPSTGLPGPGGGGGPPPSAGMPPGSGPKPPAGSGPPTGMPPGAGPKPPGGSGPPGMPGMPPGYGKPPPGSGPPASPGMPPGYGKPPPGSGPPASPGMPPGYGKPPSGSGPPASPGMPPGYGKPPPGSGPPASPGMPPGYGKPPGGSGPPPSPGMPPGYGKPPGGSGPPSGPGMPPGYGKPPGGGGSGPPPSPSMPPGSGKPPGGGGGPPGGGMPPGSGPTPPSGGGGPPSGGMPPGSGPTPPAGGPPPGMPPGSGPTPP